MGQCNPMAVFQTIYQTLDNNLVDFEIKFFVFASNKQIPRTAFVED